MDGVPLHRPRRGRREVDPSQQRRRLRGGRARALEADTHLLVQDQVEGHLGRLVAGLELLPERRQRIGERQPRPQPDQEARHPLHLGEHLRADAQVSDRLHQVQLEQAGQLHRRGELGRRLGRAEQAAYRHRRRAGLASGFSAGWKAGATFCGERVEDHVPLLGGQEAVAGADRQETA